MNSFRMMFCVVFVLLHTAMVLAGTILPEKNRDDEVKGAIGAYLENKTSGLGWEIKVKRITMSGKNILPEGPLDFEVIAPQQWEGWGSVNLTVYVRQHDRVVANLSARVDVEAMAEMVVTTHQIDHGSLISADDIMLQRRDVASAGGKFLRNISDVVGKKARTTMRGNQSVRGEQLEKVPLVKSGQMVTIVAENEVMKVTVAGKARGNGSEGDVIMVQNLSSLKEIPAKVLNSTTVQVGF